MIWWIMLFWAILLIVYIFHWWHKNMEAHENDAFLD